MKVHFSSNRQDWATPPTFLEFLKEKWGWVPSLDVAASAENTKALFYFNEEDDGLSRVWRGNVWMNPPFGREIPKWIDKCISENAKGNTDSIVALVPARTETQWAHRAFRSCSAVFFIKGRLDFRIEKFTKAKAAPFPSMLLIWGESENEGLNLPFPLMLPMEVPLEFRRWVE